MTPQQFELEQFEKAVYGRNHENASRLLLNLLALFDRNYGDLSDDIVFKVNSVFKEHDRKVDHFFDRLATAISTMFADPGFQLSENGFLQFMALQRWLGMIFLQTPSRNADHVVYGLDNNSRDRKSITIRTQDFYKIAVLVFGDSEVPIDLDLLWQVNPLVAGSVAIGWVAPRFLASSTAYRRREYAIQWLAAHLHLLDVSEFDKLPKNILPDLYMHCSYALDPEKHNVKKSLHMACSGLLGRYGIHDLSWSKQRELPMLDGRPVMIVLLEWFFDGHSIFRTHSTSLRACRDQFYMIGVGLQQCVDQKGRAVFDEFVVLNGGWTDQVNIVRRLIAEKDAQVFFMPSVGMSLITILMASVRSAPVQLTALGHGASTQSPWIDYFAVDEDFIGDPSTFSEKIIALPVDAMPFVPADGGDVSSNLPVSISEVAGDPFRIAVTASTMKINPAFLDACRQIAEKAQKTIEYHFLVLGSRGVVWRAISRFIEETLGARAVVHQNLPYKEYMNLLRSCEMYITPFPYGNMNGIADATLCGLVGICKSGPQVHEHIDAGLFQRLGLPEWAIASTVDDYINAAVRMADDDHARKLLRQELVDNRKLDDLYRGRPGILGERLREIVQATCTAD